jgi:hypothetical protein
LISDKLTLKLDKYFFVVYPRETKGYYFYNKAEGKVFFAHNDVFMEKEFLSKGVSGSKVQLKEIQETPENVSAPIDLIQEVQDVEASTPRRSMRAHHVTKKFTLLTTKQRDILLFDNDEPMTYRDAMMGPDSEKWLGAMESKIESMYNNQVWNLVYPIDGVRRISCKCVFKKKIDKDGNIHIYKARLVAKSLKRFMVLTMMKLSHRL